MKKFTLTLIAVLISTVFTIGQESNPHGTGNVNAGRDFETCPPNFLFGQEPSSPTGGWTSPISDITNPYDGLYNNYFDNFFGVTGEICSLSFWGIPWQWNTIWFPCTENPMTFRVQFYENNAGSLGAQVLDFNVDILGESTGLIYLEGGGEIGELLYYEVQLPQTLNMNAGWVSVQGVGFQTVNNCGFGWMNSPSGDNAAIYEGPVGSYQPTSYNFSFCLGTACPSPLIPVSAWALVLGGVLIALVVFTRYRRII